MVFCIMLNCGNDNRRVKGTYCRVPVVRENEGRAERERTEERRRLWLKAISRDDLTDSILTHERVCFRHFVSGKRRCGYWMLVA